MPGWAARIDASGVSKIGMISVRSLGNFTTKVLAKVPASYAPLFMRTDEGVVLAQDWAAGFLAAIRLRLEAWRPLLEAETSRLLLPILVHIPASDAEGHIADLPASARQHLAEVYHHIPTAVAALHDLRYRSAAERHTSPRRH
jgi:uncharacterized protein